MGCGGGEYEEQITPYRVYIVSQEWKDRRKAYLKISPCCELCGIRKKLHVHHITYENLMHEPDKDLQTLCKDCHKKEHIRLYEKELGVEEGRFNKPLSKNYKKCNVCGDFTYKYNKEKEQCLECDRRNAIMERRIESERKEEERIVKIMQEIKRELL